MQVQQYDVGGGFQLGASTAMAMPTAPNATPTALPALATAATINTPVVSTATGGPSGTGSNRSDDSFMRANMFAGDSGQSNPPRSTLSLATDDYTAMGMTEDVKPRVALVTSSAYFRHEMGAHPENAERLRAAYRYLQETGLSARLPAVPPRPAPRDEPL